MNVERRPHADTADQGHEAGRENGSARSSGHLKAQQVVVSFAGLRALDEVSIEVMPGRVTGLIGPNGSGKTTFLNVISGAQRADKATMELDGARIDGLSAHERARTGIARTFQAIRLFETLTVIDNLMLGATRQFRSSLLGSVVRSPLALREQRKQRHRAEDILSMFGDRLLPRTTHQVASLSYANRRRVELARALMLEPSLLLLDEPTAGMNPHETSELTEQIAQLMSFIGCSVLLVEHKMDVVVRLCERVYVLDHGELLAEGDPRAVQDDSAVAEAFLGVE